MTFSSPTRRSEATLHGLLRIMGALGITILLLGFLIISRWFTPDTEVLKIRPMQTTDEPVSQPAPPPPPLDTPTDTPPPPPPPVDAQLPKLELTINDMAPPVQAQLIEQKLDIRMKPAEFVREYEPPKAASLYSSAELDTQPRLVYRPTVRYPSSMSRRNIWQGKVTLEVLINSSGRVHIRRVISHSHPDFIPMAKSFASRSRFTPPKKDGRIVNAVFNWPLVLKP